MNHTVAQLTSSAVSKAGVILLAMMFICGGCASDDTKPKPPRYQSLGKRNVPAFMKGTVYEVANLENTNLYPVSGYGLVVGLAGTGGNAGTPGTVRDYMLDEMFKHGIGISTGAPGDPHLKPERLLDDPRNSTSIVTVVGLIPPGRAWGSGWI